MPYSVEGKLVVAISSRALFDFEEENRVFERDGETAYIALQFARLDVPAREGVAFPLVKKLLAFNTAEAQRVEVVILSKNDPVSGLRVFRSAAKAGLKLERGVFTRGRSPYRYLDSLNANLFLSANENDVMSALEAKCPAARVYPESAQAASRHANEVRIAFDGDAVLFSDEAEAVYQRDGLEAGKQRLWQQVQELLDSGEIVKMKVSASNSGGLIGNLSDLKAFLPISQLSTDHYNQVADSDRQKTAEGLKKFIGEEMQVKVINVNPRVNKLIVSERETVNANVKELLAKYEVGQTVPALVSGLADFGIFVRFADNPQIEGLVHISEIDHRIVDNPKEIVKMGEAIQVKIIDIRENRVFLSLKALKEDPWEKVADFFKEGDVVKGTVYKFNPFGATVDLEHGIQGMIHVSEFGSLEEMKKEIAPGEEYSFKIESLKLQEKRISLKIQK